MDSFYSADELEKMGFKKIGKNVRLSRKTSIYNISEISIGDHARIDDFALLSGCIEIGRNAHIAAYAALFAGKAGIIVGDFCGISARCSVYAASDDYSGQAMTNPTIPDQYRLVKEKRVVFQKHVIIGAGSTVLPGVVIEEGASFGAMSLIVRDAGPWMMYAGIPARELRPRERKPLLLEKEYLNDRMG